MNDMTFENENVNSAGPRTQALKTPDQQTLFGSNEVSEIKMQGKTTDKHSLALDGLSDYSIKRQLFSDDDQLNTAKPGKQPQGAKVVKQSVTPQRGKASLMTSKDYSNPAQSNSKRAITPLGNTRGSV